MRKDIFISSPLIPDTAILFQNPAISEISVFLQPIIPGPQTGEDRTRLLQVLAQFGF
jgi:hypothetical protein